MPDLPASPAWPSTSSSSSGCSMKRSKGSSRAGVPGVHEGVYAVFASTCSSTSSPYRSRTARTGSTSQPGSILSLIARSPRRGSRRRRRQRQDAVPVPTDPTAPLRGPRRGGAAEQPCRPELGVEHPRSAALPCRGGLERSEQCRHRVRLKADRQQLVPGPGSSSNTSYASACSEEVSGLAIATHSPTPRPLVGDDATGGCRSVSVPERVQEQPHQQRGDPPPARHR